MVAAGRQPTPALARALNHLGNLELDLGELTTAGEHYRAALALREATGDQTGTADTLNNLGLVALAESRLDDATGLHGRSRAIRRALGDASGEALSLSNLGDVALAAGDHARAMALQREAAATYESLGNERRLAYALANLAEATLRPGGPDDLAAAGPLLTRAGALFDELDDPTGRALVLVHLGMAAAVRGDAPAALGHLRAALALRREQGQLPGVVECVERIGGLAEDPRLLAAADATRDERGWPRSPAAAAAWAVTVRAARAASTAGAFSAAWDAGRALGLESAIELALSMAVGPLAPAPTITSARNGLSAREVEVLRLVAAGLTNAQIGDRLFLSHTTINAHLRRIYPKIGVDNRAAASTFTAAAGLLEGSSSINSGDPNIPPVERDV